MFLFREQREMLASDLAKNSESLSPHRSPDHEVQAVENVRDLPTNKVRPSALKEVNRNNVTFLADLDYYRDQSFVYLNDQQQNS